MNSRHKVRFWDTKKKVMLYAEDFMRPEGRAYDCEMYPDGTFRIYSVMDDTFEGSERYIRMDCTGRADNNQNDIWEGDIIEVRTPYRSYRGHRGNNILLGFCKEPMEAGIEIITYIIIYRSAEYGIDNDGGFAPLLYYDFHYDKGMALYGFETNNEEWDGEDGLLAYLLDKYKLNDEQDLLKYLGIKVIGNIHENPELLEVK